MTRDEIEALADELDEEFRRILWGTPQALYKDLQVGDLIIHVCVPDMVTAKTEGYVKLKSGEKLPFYWRHSTVQRITLEEQDFLLDNAAAYRIWLIHDKAGLLKALGT